MTYKATYTGWIGYTLEDGRATDAFIEAGMERDDTDPLVIARPDLFVQLERPEVEQEIQRQRSDQPSVSSGDAAQTPQTARKTTPRGITPAGGRG
jgi:hypothetical protein